MNNTMSALYGAIDGDVEFSILPAMLNIMSIILTILEGESFKLCQLTGLMAYIFAGLANKFCGGL